MALKTEVEAIRNLAVEHHNAAATYFDEEYKRMEEDYYADPFLYGRKKIDDLLYGTVQSLPQGSRILDVGCGTGEQLRRCRELGYDVAGIEPAPELRELSRMHNPGIEIQDGSILDIPLDDEQFDFVLNIEVLRYLHSEDIPKAYQEMLRVMKPGGKMFLTLVNLFAMDGFLIYEKLKKLLVKLTGRPALPHCEYVTPSRIRRELGALGVHEVAMHGRLFGPIRFAYFLNKPLGRFTARKLESFDDAFSRMQWTTAFAGHLIVIATKPESS